MSRRIQAVLNLGDRGVIELPQEITSHRETAAKLAELDTDQAPAEHPDDLADRLVQETIEAVATGATVNYGAVREVREAAELAELRVRSIQRAREDVESQLDNEVRHHAEQLVRLMQPKFASIVAELKAALTLAAQWPDQAAALNAPPKIRAVLASRFTLRAELDALLAARRSLHSLGYQPARDVNAEYGLLRDMNVAYPRRARQFGGPPWGSGDLVDWALTNNGTGELWLPTVPEQDARYDEVHKADEEEQTRNLARMRSMTAGFGSVPQYDPVVDRPQRPAPRGAAVTIEQRLFGQSAEVTD